MIRSRRLLAVVAFAMAATLSACASERDPIPGPTTSPPTVVPSATPTPTPTPTPTFDRAQFSIDDPASPWVVVNKLRPLQPTTYVPADLVRVPVPYANEPFLRQEAADAVVALFAAAQAEAGLSLQSQSAYRSYDVQVRIYNGIVDSRGEEFANLVSARPGHSEHQTGLTIDISSVPSVCALDPCFGDTDHGRWLAANAHRFGFHLRYQPETTPITGYSYEPWHFRYVGVELATELHDTGVRTLEEFFGLPAAPTYAG